MGQYHYVVNLDKHEFLDPHQLGCGLKLWEQLANFPSTGTALIPLLACSNGRGGGDLNGSNEVIGRWAGDRIAIVGDYGEDSDLPEFAESDPASTIYARCGVESTAEALDGYSDAYKSEYAPKIDGKPIYKDITPLVCKLIEDELDGRFVGTGWHEFKRNGD